MVQSPSFTRLFTFTYLVQSSIFHKLESQTRVTSSFEVNARTDLRSSACERACQSFLINS